MVKLFDSHFHVIDPKFEMPGNNGYFPDYYTVEDHLEKMKKDDIELVGGAVVSGSFQGYDQTYFTDALEKLGENFVGITQLPADVSDEELQRLDKIGIKGIRFNLYRGLKESLSDIKKFTNRVHKMFGWQTEFYINLAEADKELTDMIIDLPKTSIDHFGMTKVPFEKIEHLLSNGVPFRVTGLGRIEYSREEALELIKKMYAVNPDGVIFGTDLPGTCCDHPFTYDDVLMITDHFDAEAADKILYQNGLDWYVNKSK